MIRIAHLSDFHLDKRTLNDWENYCKEAFLSKLEELSQIKNIDIVAFTGDLIDKGGKDFGGAENGFKQFNEKIIMPILSRINLPVNNFIINCGNHDIERNADNLRSELGSRAYFDNENIITDFIITSQKQKNYDGIRRIERFKNFETALYNRSPDTSINIFESSHIIKCSNKIVGIVSLNSSWRCYDDEDMGRLIIGEQQLSANYSKIKSSDVKIALVHHPIDWLSNVEKGIISGHLNAQFDIVLSGHVHTANTAIQTGFTGTLFTNISPSGLNDIRSDSRSSSNGFTIVDVHDEYIETQYFRYHHEGKKFIINSDLGENGKFQWNKPLKRNSISISVISKALENIREEHFSRLDEHFLGVKAEVIKSSIKDLFVLPVILQSSQEDLESGLTLQEILKTDENIIFFGTQEVGKTSLLFRLVREFVDEYEFSQKIPAYINFEELFNHEINTLVKEFLGISSKDLKGLLDDNKIVLLVDNLDYSNFLRHKDNFNKIHKFKKDYPKSRIIATAENDIGIISTEYIKNCRIGFNTFFIKSLRTKEIKSLMRQWLPDDGEVQKGEKLDKLVTTFRSYSLPNTPMSVSLYLWSLENKQRKPINQAVLMEIYLELLLEKISKENIYRESFDFLNKIQLVAKIAQEMLIIGRKNYSLTYSEFAATIDDYLNNLVGFHYDTQVIINYFFNRKIFVSTKDNYIKFPYRCFFHFFVAKRMEYDTNFRDVILDEETYFKYPKEIDYYTGLVRSDKKTFSLIYDRFKKLFQPLDFILNEVDLDDYYKIIKETEDQKAQEPVVRNIEIARVKENRPSEEQMEAIYDEQLKKIGNPSIIDVSKENITHDRLLLIMCNVLRNSEGIEDLNLKKEAYGNIIKSTLSFGIFYTQWIIKYFLDNKKMPSHIPKYITLDEALQNNPYHMQYSIYQQLGTLKLSQIISAKIEDDARGRSFTKSEIESYTSVVLYADIQGPNFDKYLKSYVKKVKTVSVQNYLLQNIINYYYRRTSKDSPNEELYLSLIADLKTKTENISNRLKKEITNFFKNKKSNLPK